MNLLPLREVFLDNPKPMTGCIYVELSRNTNVIRPYWKYNLHTLTLTTVYGGKRSSHEDVSIVRNYYMNMSTHHYFRISGQYVNCSSQNHYTGKRASMITAEGSWWIIYALHPANRVGLVPNANANWTSEYVPGDRFTETVLLRYTNCGIIHARCRLLSQRVICQRAKCVQFM